MAALLPAVMTGGGADLGTRTARIVARTGHLHPIQMMRLKDLLGGSSAMCFMQAAAHFADGDRQAFNSMTALLDHAGATGWTAATVLPFLWRPDIHMLLKPESTRNFARWAGHPFATTYASEREFKVYDVCWNSLPRPGARSTSCARPTRSTSRASSGLPPGMIGMTSDTLRRAGGRRGQVWTRRHRLLTDALDRVVAATMQRLERKSSQLRAASHASGPSAAAAHRSRPGRARSGPCRPAGATAGARGGTGCPGGWRRAGPAG